GHVADTTPYLVDRFATAAGSSVELGPDGLAASVGFVTPAVGEGGHDHQSPAGRLVWAHAIHDPWWGRVGVGDGHPDSRRVRADLEVERRPGVANGVGGQLGDDRGDPRPRPSARDTVGGR